MTEETTQETTESTATTTTDETAAPATDATAQESSSEPTAVVETSEKESAETETSKDTESSPEEPTPEESSQGLPKVHTELHQLVDFSTKYPEIGPVVARLANRLGYTKIAERVLRLGLQEDHNPVEYYFVATRLARSESRKEDALKTVLEALDSTKEALKGEKEIEKADRSRLLHIVRLGFATLMFDYEDIHSNPDFTQKLAEKLAELKDLYAEDAFYHQLLAQALWFGNVDASEDQWEVAVKFGEPEDIWNARGTWYKEASKNITKAEAAYRRGLEKTAESALLMHNLAQIIMDRAEASIRIDIPQSAILLNEAEGYLRKAKRFAHRHTMRTHVYESFDRLRKLKATIDNTTSAPEAGDVVTGRVISLKNYGAFIVLPSGHTGLLHSSEIDHYWVEDATTRYNENDAVEVKVIKVEERENGEGLRISLSRKALIEKPADFDESLAKPPNRRNKDNRGGEKKGGERNSGRRGKSSGKRDENSTSNSNNRGRGRRNNRKSDTPSHYKDSGTGVTIADLLSAKLNLQPKEDKS